MRKQRKCLRNGWIDEELVGCEFSDVRLNKRFRKLLEQLSGGIGESIPWACQDWANTKAAYRFLSNAAGERGRNSERTLSGHARSFSGGAMAGF
jgi:Transposase DNA-binding